LLPVCAVSESLPPRRVAVLFERIVSGFDRIGFAWLLMAVSVLTLAGVAVLNPAKLGAYLWFISKLSGAAVLGYSADIAFFRGANPRYLDGLDKAMAQTRRATVIAAFVIGAGLIG